jgi:hypothetical protein
MRWTFARGVLAPTALACVVAACALRTRDEGVRESEDSLTQEQIEQCATRLAIAFTGVSASSTLATSPDPQAGVPDLLKSAAFIDRFAKFMNARLNPRPGDAGEDATYALTKYVLENGKPFADIFTGPYNVDPAGLVTVDPAGLGYFRSRTWMVRYAGNEGGGFRLVGAYRILQNTTGLRLAATTNVVGVDLSTTGRLAPACRGCHYDPWFALDKVARVLSKRKDNGDEMTFIPPTEVPQVILGGQSIYDDKGLVTALVASEHFKFNACRHVFNFLYGRDESTGEAATFDKCVDAFTSNGMIQTAIAAVARDPSFCE